MTHHPHVHMIVPGGGIALDGKRWLSCQPRFLLPVPLLTKVFQGLMLAKLLAAHKAGRLTFFGQHAHLAGVFTQPGPRAVSRDAKHDSGIPSESPLPGASEFSVDFSESCQRDPP